VRFRVRILRRAWTDLVEIRDYQERESPGAGIACADRLLEAAAGLASFPRRGSVPRDERLRRAGFRYLAVDRFLLFFKVGGAPVRVYRIIHGRNAYQGLL
jgi:plasmid stabilization system protein ParE